MVGMYGSTAVADLANGNAYRETQNKDTNQTPSHRNPRTCDPLYNAIPKAVHSTNYGPSPTVSQHQDDSEEHHIKLDLPSWPTFATHTTPGLKSIGRRSQIETAGINRRLCFSLDEKALLDLHHRHQYSSTTASHQRSSVPSDQSPQHTAPEPIAPPYPPPNRTRTPDGVPSWPGPLILQNRDARQQQEHTDNFLRRSSRKLSRFFARILDDRPGGRKGERARVRRVFGLKRYREEPPRAAARWRPPISGHSTFRFDSLDAHPFSGPSLSDEPYVGGHLTGVRRQRKVFSSSLSDSQCSVSEDPYHLLGAHGIHAPLARREEAVPPSKRRRAMNRPRRSSGSGNSVIVSPSVRALAALRGLPLPVPAEHVEAETARLSAPIPRSKVRSPVNGLGSQRRFSDPTSTMRTVDLIKSFPQPPSARTPRSRHSAPARMSLFPVVAGLKECSGNVQGTSPSKMRLELLESVVESAKNRKRASASSGPMQAIVSGAAGTGSPSTSNFWVSGALPQPSDYSRSEDVATCSSPLVRGEDLECNLPLDSLVYDRVTTSLCSVDDTEGIDTAVPTSHPDTPVSGKTGMTRYFSATSQMALDRNVLTTAAPSTVLEPQVLCKDEHQVQRERAVANGALRFSYHAPTESADSGASHLPGHDAIVPVRTMGLTRTCSHKTHAIRTRRSVGRDGLDGTQDLDGTQESQDSSVRKSKRELHCLRCEVKRVVQQVVRSMRRRHQGRI